MPSLGADMESGVLVDWKVRPGDTVKRGDVVALVETEKGVIEVEIFESGVVESLVVQPGQKVPVGATLATSAPRPDSGDAAAPRSGSGRRATKRKRLRRVKPVPSRRRQKAFVRESRRSRENAPRNWAWIIRLDRHR